MAWLPRRACETWQGTSRRSLRRSLFARRDFKRTVSGTRFAATVVAGLLAGLSLPQSAFAPAAQAHDRIDISPRAAALAASALDARAPSADAPEAGTLATAHSEDGAEWNGLPVADQEPATATLIAGDLAALPRVTQESGTGAVRFGSRSVPLKVVDTIVKASEEAGVDPVYMMALADKESSFDTDAKAATSSAQGLFQFVAGTWLEMIRSYGARYGLGDEAAAVKGRGGAITVAGGMRERVLGLRNDPRVAALMAAELVKRDRGRIEARVGRALSTTELYLAHFLGTASAGRFLSLSSEKPDAVAGRAFGSAARANRSLFTRTTGGKRRHLTVAELHGRIEGMIDSRLNRYQGVAAVAGAVENAAAPTDAAADAASGMATAAGARRFEVTEALPPDGE